MGWRNGWGEGALRTIIIMIGQDTMRHIMLIMWGWDVTGRMIERIIEVGMRESGVVVIVIGIMTSLVPLLKFLLHYPIQDTFGDDDKFGEL